MPTSSQIFYSKGGIKYVASADAAIIPSDGFEFTHLVVIAANTVISALTNSDGTNLLTDYTLGSVQLPVGTIIPAKGQNNFITGLDLSAGSVIGYKR